MRSSGWPVCSAIRRAISFFVCANCSAWMVMSEAYQFTAELADGSEDEIVILPLTRSRQARSQEMKELPYLGDGYVFGEELQDENGDTRGGRFIFWEEVSLDDVVDVHIYQ